MLLQYFSELRNNNLQQNKNTMFDDEQVFYAKEKGKNDCVYWLVYWLRWTFYREWISNVTNGYSLREANVLHIVWWFVLLKKWTIYNDLLMHFVLRKDYKAIIQKPQMRGWHLRKILKKLCMCRNEKQCIEARKDGDHRSPTVWKFLEMIQTKGPLLISADVLSVCAVMEIEGDKIQSAESGYSWADKSYQVIIKTKLNLTWQQLRTLGKCAKNIPMCLTLPLQKISWGYRELSIKVICCYSFRRIWAGERLSPSGWWLTLIEKKIHIKIQNPVICKKPPLPWSLQRVPIFLQKNKNDNVIPVSEHLSPYHGFQAVCIVASFM